MRKVLIIIGVLMLLVGGIWLLQGIGILLGSIMSRQPFWAIMGLIMIICGGITCFFGLRSKPANLEK